MCDVCVCATTGHCVWTEARVQPQELVSSFQHGLLGDGTEAVSLGVITTFTHWAIASALLLLNENIPVRQWLTCVLSWSLFQRTLRNPHRWCNRWDVLPYPISFVDHSDFIFTSNKKFSPLNLAEISWFSRSSTMISPKTRFPPSYFTFSKQIHLKLISTCV